MQVNMEGKSSVCVLVNVCVLFVGEVPLEAELMDACVSA